MGLQQKAKEILRQDELKKKVSAQEHFFLNQRQEMLVNLLELGRALVNSRREKDFWKTLSSAITAQTGSRQIAIFFREQERIVLKSSLGFHFNPGFRFPLNSRLIMLLQEKKELLEFEQIEAHLRGREFVWLKSLQPRLIVPLYQNEDNHENLAGLLLVSPPLSSQEEKSYSHEEKVYLTLLGEILGYFYENVKRMIYVQEQTKLWQKREELQKKYNMFLEDMQVCQSMDTAIRNCRNFLASLINNGTYALLSVVRDGKTFVSVFTQGLLPETEGRMRFSESENWIQESRSYSGWSKYQDFDEDDNLLSVLEYEMIATQKKEHDDEICEMHVLPLYMLGFLKGLFLFFGSQNNLEDDSLHYIQAALQQFMWFRESLSLDYGGDSLQTIVHKSLQDPLFSLRERYNQYEKQFKADLQPYSVVTIRFSNYARLQKLGGKPLLQNITKKIQNYFSEKLNEQDFYAQIFPQQYIIVLKNYNNKKAYRFSEGLEKILRGNYREKERPLLQIKTVSRLDNDFMSFEELFL